VIINEFNSYFTTGKRGLMAVIKDVFTATEIVDMTSPSQAVIDTISNMSRAFRNGMMLTSLSVMFDLMRMKLIKLFCIDKVIKESIMEMLDCSEDFLPYHLGYLSRRHIMSQVLYGPDFLMFDPENSDNLNHFYKALYTSVKEEITDFTDNGVIESLTSQYRVILPYRTDKRMKNMISEFFGSREDTIENVLQRMNDNWLFPTELELDPLAEDMRVMSYFIGMRRNYSFTDSFHMHSVVRAMQACSNRLIVKPSKDLEMSLMEFVSFIMMKSEENSSLNIMANESKIMSLTTRAAFEMKNMVVSRSLRHNRRRKITFTSIRTSVKATKKEVLSLIRLEEGARKSRVFKALEDICKSINMDVLKLIENSTMEVAKVFSFSKYPYLAFVDYIEDFLSSLINNSTKVMCSFVDKGNDMENLTHMMGERINPCYIMTTDMEDMNSRFNRTFQTMISLGMELDSTLLTSMITDKALNLDFIFKEDSRETTAYKMYLSQHFSRTNIVSEKIITSIRKTLDGYKQILFSSLEETIVMTFVLKRVWVEIYTNSSKDTFDHNSELMRRFNMEVSAEQIKKNTIRFVENKSKDLKKEMVFMSSDKTWDCNLKRKKTRYNIDLRFKTVFGIHYVNYFGDSFKVDMNSLTEETDVMDLIKKALYKDSTLSDLNDLVAHMYMGVPMDVVISSFSDKGTLYSIDISEVMASAMSEFDIMDFEKEFSKAFSTGMMADLTLMELNPLDTLSNSLIDNEALSEISAMFANETDEMTEDFEDIPVRETVVVIKIIMRAVKSYINKNYCINPVFTKAFTGKEMDEEKRNKVWSIVYTEVNDIFKDTCSRSLIDIIFAVVATMVKSKTMMKAPKKVKLYGDMVTYTKCIQKYIDTSVLAEEYGL